MSANTVLIIGAHHEEVEAEFPNTVVALAAAGCRIVILNPVGGWNWTAIRSMENGRERTICDALAAASKLGCEKIIWDYPIGQLPCYRNEVLPRMAELLVDLRPEIVLIHWAEDIHPDHRAVAAFSRLAISSGAANLCQNLTKKWMPQEVYAFQTGPGQAYHFTPDILVKTDAKTMAIADEAIECFRNTMPESVETWKTNFHTKAEYWGNLAGSPAEAFRFLGPMLPLDGFLLRKILGNRIVTWYSSSFTQYSEF